VLSHSSKDTESDVFADAKIAVGKLSAVQGRVEALVLRMIIPHISRFGSFFGRSSVIETAEKDILRFGDALIALIRLTKGQERDLNLARIMKNLERSQSFNEIVTLMGLTVLGEYREQLERRAQIMKLWKDEIQPQMQKVLSLAEFGNELTNLSQRIRDLLNYDTATREDDIIRMILAVNERRFDLFNEICEKLQQRIDTEERAESKKA
jgi:hypothetical protein